MEVDGWLLVPGCRWSLAAGRWPLIDAKNKE